MEGLEREVGVRWVSPSAQWLSEHYQSWGLLPSCWSVSLKGQALAGSVPFKCVFLSPCTGTLASEWGSGDPSGDHWGPCGLLAHVSHRQRSKLSLMCCLHRHPQLFPSLSSNAAYGASPLCPSQLITASSLHCPSRAGGSCMESQHVLGAELW